MKYRNSFAILAFSAAFLLAGCGEQPASSAPAASSLTPAETITVTFNTDGGSAVASQTIAKGSKATRPSVDPTKEGYVFDDWYADAICATLFDFDQALNANTTVYAGWEEGSDIDSGSEDIIDDDLIYFREATWWNSATGFPMISVNGAGVTGEDPNITLDFTQLIKMDYVATVQESATAYYNVYSIDPTYLSEAETIQIFRCGPHYENDEPTDVVESWGAWTEVITFAGRGEHNMYDIHDCEKPAAWVEGAAEGASRAVSGVWADYDPTDIPDVSVDSGEDSRPSGDYYGPEGSSLVEWYIVGEGSLFSGWNTAGGLELYTNPNNAEDKGCLLNVAFVEGDLFKVTDGGSTWFGYEGVDKYEDPANKGLTCFEAAEDGYGGSNFKCTVSGNYDVYVNGSGVFWITNHA